MDRTTVCAIGTTNGNKIMARAYIAIDNSGKPDYDTTIREVKNQLLKSGTIPQRILILVV